MVAMIRGTPFVLLLAGCFSIPPYEPEVSVSYTAAGTGAVVAGPGFSLRFADGTGFHFPDELKIDGADVMGHESAPGCFGEDGIGVVIAPTERISASVTTTPVKNVLTPVLRGPAIVQMKVEWGTQFSCDTKRSPGGTSTFTVFPEGRIVRHDVFDVPASDKVISPVPCACEEPMTSKDSLFNVSTFWTLARAPFSELYATSKAPLPMRGDEIGNQPVSCVDGGAYQVAFAWPDVDNTTIRGNVASLSFGRYVDLGLTEIDRYTSEESSALFIEHGTCATALDRAGAYRDPQAIMIGGAVKTPSERDGIYGGDTGDGSPPGIPLSALSVEVSGPTPRAYAVWLRFPSAVKELRARLDGAQGAWYLPQRVDDGSWIVWFRDALTSGQTITIEPR
jgi:hypothetical protein